MNEKKIIFPIILESNVLTEELFNKLIIKNKIYIKNFLSDFECSTTYKQKIEKELSQVKEQFEQIYKEKIESDKRNNDLKNIIDINNKKNQELIEKNEELKNVIDLNDKKKGDHSMYKGEFEEKKKNLF